MSEYTPIEDDIRDQWAMNVSRSGQASLGEGYATFDRWLAAHDAELTEKCAQVADDRLHPDDPHCEICRVVAAIRALSTPENGGRADG